MGRPRKFTTPGPDRRPVDERFWEKVDTRGSDECWPWLAQKNKAGYGSFKMPGRDGRRTTAHRMAYVLAGGAIPEGWYVDHLCRNPSCCNPEHLEAVTPRENTLRGEVRQRELCRHGHPLDGWTTSAWGHKTRYCRTCKNAASRAAYWRRKAAREAEAA